MKKITKSDFIYFGMYYLLLAIVFFSMSTLITIFVIDGPLWMIIANMIISSVIVYPLHEVIMQKLRKPHKTKSRDGKD